MTGTDLCVNKPHKSRSYLNHLVLALSFSWRYTDANSNSNADFTKALFTSQSTRVNLIPFMVYVQ
jgi:hypothetical protein